MTDEQYEQEDSKLLHLYFKMKPDFDYGKFCTLYASDSYLSYEIKNGEFRNDIVIQNHIELIKRKILTTRLGKLLYA